MTTVTEALLARISTRAFLPTPVSESTLRHLLDTARWSPSGGNTQPWKVIVVAGSERDAVISAAKRGQAANPLGEAGAYPLYPADLWEPHRSRRYNLGEEMYELLGIGRDNKAGRFAHLARNYEFFGAPVGIFFVIDGRMGHGQWAHLGMFMQSLALVATESGLATCFQEAWGMVRESLKAHFGLADTEVLYCGMALGYADPDAPVNRLRSTRAEVDDFASFRGLPE